MGAIYLIHWRPTHAPPAPAVLLALTLVACQNDTQIDCIDDTDRIGDTDGAGDDTDGGDTDSGDTDSKDTDSGDTDVEPVDSDSDGYADDVDCDDANAAIHPGATDTCDGIDNDCDSTTEGGVPFPGDHASLQAAVDAAPDGSEICVAPGIYTTHATIDTRDLTIAAAGPAHAVTFVAEVAGSPILDVKISTLTVTGIDFTGGDAEKTAAIAVDQGVFTLSDSRIYENAASGQDIVAVVGATDADVTLLRVDFDHNSADIGLATAPGGASSGTALSITGGSPLWEGGSVADNTTHFTSSLVSSGSTASGTVALSSTAATVHNVTWSRNSLDVKLDGTGATFLGTLLAMNTDLELHDATFSKNGITRSGGGVEAWVAPLLAVGGDTAILTSQLIATNLVFDQNEVSNAHGTNAGSVITSMPNTSIDGLQSYRNNVLTLNGTAAAATFYTGQVSLKHLDLRRDVLRAQTIPGWASGLWVSATRTNVENFIIADESITSDA